LFLKAAAVCCPGQGAAKLQCNSPLSAAPETEYTESEEGLMTITIEIPDELAAALTPSGRDLCRAALEAIALDGYRSDRLTEADVRQLLGFETRMEVHGFLKEHGAFLPYTLQDLEHDREVARQVARLAQRQRQEEPANNRHPR
jgi:hypothetical protein